MGFNETLNGSMRTMVVKRGSGVRTYLVGEHLRSPKRATNSVAREAVARVIAAKRGSEHINAEVAQPPGLRMDAVMEAMAKQAQNVRDEQPAV